MKQDAESMELWLAKLLKLGVLFSAAVIALGVFLFLFTGQSGYADGVFPTSPGEIWAGLLVLKPFAVMLTGLFLLILTPILRVGRSILLFWRQGDRLYVVITASVFLILIISLFLGKVE